MLLGQWLQNFSHRLQTNFANSQIRCHRRNRHHRIRYGFSEIGTVEPCEPRVLPANSALVSSGVLTIKFGNTANEGISLAEDTAIPIPNVIVTIGGVPYSVASNVRTLVTEIRVVEDGTVVSGNNTISLSNAKALFTNLQIVSIDGNDGNDTITGSILGDVITGGIGDDSILGGDGNDTLNGENGIDSLFGQNGSDALLGGSQNDSLDGGAGADELNGQLDNDTLLGGDDADNLVGGGGDDLLVGGAGIDTISGQSGHDTYRVETGDQVASDSGVGEINTLDFSLLTTGITLDLAASADAELDAVTTLAGIFATDTTAKVKHFRNIIGGQGADDLKGTNQDESLSGGGGNDTINGRDGDDSLSGGDGHDLILGGGGNDSVYGDSGNDRVIGDIGNDLLIGGLGNDTLGDGRSAITGTSLVSFAAVQNGLDTITRSDGSFLTDGFVVGQMIKVSGAVVSQNNGTFTISQVTALELTVGATDLANETSVTNVSIIGESGMDVLVGGYGADTLDGGVDGDVLLGGEVDLVDGLNVGLTKVRTEWTKTDQQGVLLAFTARIAEINKLLMTNPNGITNTVTPPTAFDDFLQNTMSGDADSAINADANYYFVTDEVIAGAVDTRFSVADVLPGSLVAGHRYEATTGFYTSIGTLPEPALTPTPVVPGSIYTIQRISPAPGPLAQMLVAPDATATVTKLQGGSVRPRYVTDPAISIDGRFTQLDVGAVGTNTPDGSELNYTLVVDGASSNARSAPTIPDGQLWRWSQNPAEPHIQYAVKYGEGDAPDQIIRYDIRNPSAQTPNVIADFKLTMNSIAKSSLY